MTDKELISKLTKRILLLENDVVETNNILESYREEVRQLRITLGYLDAFCSKADEVAHKRGKYG